MVFYYLCKLNRYPHRCGADFYYGYLKAIEVRSCFYKFFLFFFVKKFSNQKTKNKKK